MIKELIPCYDILLHTKVQKCSYNLDRSKISCRLHENMYHYKGIGLSANQIGINERVFVMILDLDMDHVCQGLRFQSERPHQETGTRESRSYVGEGSYCSVVLTPIIFVV